MPNKAISWTQVPVTAADLLSIHYDRRNATGTQNLMTVGYEVKDSVGVVRFIRTISQVVASYPVPVTTILSTINMQEGT